MFKKLFTLFSSKQVKLEEPYIIKINETDSNSLKYIKELLTVANLTAQKSGKPKVKIFQGEAWDGKNQIK